MSVSLCSLNVPGHDTSHDVSQEESISLSKVQTGKGDGETSTSG